MAAAPRGRRRGRRSSSSAARSGSATGAVPIRDVARARARPARRRDHRPRRDRARRPSRTTRSAGRAAFYEFNCTAVEVEVDARDRRRHDRPPRDRVRRRQGAQPAPGPRPGRGRGGHGPRPHADGALHLRRRRAGSGTSAPSTTGSRPSMDLPLRMESDIVENDDGPGPYGAKGMSEGALLCVAPAVAAAVARRDRRRRSGTCRSRPSGSGRRCRSRRRAREAHVYALDHRRSTCRASDHARARRREGREPRDDGSRPRAARAARLRRSRPRPAAPTWPAGWPDGLDDELRAADGRGSRRRVGRRFGDAADPLLVSVRSGAPVSMPGMMDTILDLGLNDATTAGLAAVVRRRGVRRATAATRFEAMFRVDRRRRPTSPTTRGSSSGSRSRPSSARGTAIGPAPTARRRGSPTTSGPPSRSRRWSSATAARTRRPASLFTRNPATGEPTLYGDVLFDAQGEDVVAGTHATEPIAALDERLPAVAAELRRARRAASSATTPTCCDIEFTIEDGRLWLLQVRVGKRSPQAALRIAVDMAEDPAFPLTRAEAVERVAPLLADPPTTDRRPDRRRGPPLATGLPRVARDGVGRDRDDPRGRGGRGRGGRAAHPRPGRDLARRRPRDGPARPAS